MKKMVELFGLVGLYCFFGVERAGQVISYRQQLTRDIPDDPKVSFAALPFDSLAIVFKVRLPARQAFPGLIERGLKAL